MSSRHHVSLDRLAVLAFGPALDGGPADADERVLAHVGECAECADALARLTAEADTLRELACAEVDRLFDDSKLEAQRARILDRIAHVGQAARIIAFPRRTREVAMPVARGSRRWVSVAAAAGLIIGLVTGQFLHFVPQGAALRNEGASIQAATPPQSGPTYRQASTGVPLLSDDELLEEVERLLEERRTQSLRAIDALTPTAGELLAMGR